MPFSGGGGSWLRFAKAPLAYTVKCTSKPISELEPDWFERTGIKANGQDFDFPRLNTARHAARH